MKVLLKILLNAALVIWVTAEFINTAAAAPAQFQAGRDYLVLPDVPAIQAALPGNQITVTEFFSYTCPACRHLQPDLEKWLTHKPLYVKFNQVPVVFQPEWEMYARAYYIAEKLRVLHNITPALFSAIQDQHKNLAKAAAMAEVLQQHGINKQLFLDSYHTPGIDAKLAEGRKLATSFVIFQIPSIIIDGKYKVDLSLAGADTQRLFAIVDYLIQKEAHAKAILHGKPAGETGVQPHTG